MKIILKMLHKLRTLLVRVNFNKFITRINIIEELREGDIMVVTVDTGRLPKSKVQKYLRQINDRFKDLNLKSQVLVIPNNIEVTKVVREFIYNRNGANK